MLVSWGFYAALVVIGSVGIHFFAKVSNQIASPLFAMFIASSASAILIGIIYFFTKDSEKTNDLSTKALVFMLLMGVCLALANCAVIYMYKYNAAISVAVPVTRTAVAFFAVLLGYLFFSETLSAMKIGGFILSILSIYMMTRS